MSVNQDRRLLFIDRAAVNIRDLAAQTKDSLHFNKTVMSWISLGDDMVAEGAR